MLADWPVSDQHQSIQVQQRSCRLVALIRIECVGAGNGAQDLVLVKHASQDQLLVKSGVNLVQHGAPIWIAAGEVPDMLIGSEVFSNEGFVVQRLPDLSGVLHTHLLRTARDGAPYLASILEDLLGAAWVLT